jgi:hypothetical protein
MLGSYDHVKAMGLDAKAIIDEFEKAQARKRDKNK